MAVLDSALNVGANAIAGAITHFGLASADPGTGAGANATTHARVAAGWNAAANGDITATNKAFTGGAANGPVLYVTFWSGLTGGTYHGSQPLSGDTSSNSAGEFTLASVTINTNAS